MNMKNFLGSQPKYGMLRMSRPGIKYIMASIHIHIGENSLEWNERHIQPLLQH